MPESPRFLLSQASATAHEDAAKSLRRLHTPEEAEVELKQITEQMKIDRTLPSSYIAMFRKPSYLKRTMLCLGTTCGIQFSGILVINNYGPTLCKLFGIIAGRSRRTDNKLQMLV
jgi:hypothetical protein